MHPAATILNETQKEIVLDSIINGLGNDKAAQKIGVPFRTFNNILIRDPLFAKEVARARENWIHSLVYRLIGITDGCETMAQVSAAKVESENIKWAAGKFVPEVFGDNINVNVNHTLDLSSILLAAENRVLPLLQASISANRDKQDLATLDVAPQSTITVECIPMHEQKQDTLNADAIVNIEDLF
jgi:hypothetical protein